MCSADNRFLDHPEHDPPEYGFVTIETVVGTHLFYRFGHGNRRGSVDRNGFTSLASHGDSSGVNRL